MAAPRDSYPVVDLNDEKQNSKMELEFQDFSMDSADKISPSASFAANSMDDAEESATLLIEPEDEARRPPSFWEFAYYQSFFDVNTDQVVKRLLWSVIPRISRATYIHQCIRPNPDLYGPFWICLTLVFTIAMTGNMADYLHTQGRQKEIWHYDFHKVSLAATAIYSYAFVIPLALWGLLWYRKSSANYTLLEIVCAYGYSLAIYVPISVFCIVPIQWVQWTLITAGFVLSAVVLLLTFWAAIKEDTKAVACGVLFGIVVLHMLLAVGFMTYFFMPSTKQLPVPVEPATPLPSLSTATIAALNNSENRKIRNPELSTIVQNKSWQEMIPSTTDVDSSNGTDLPSLVNNVVTHVYNLTMAPINTTSV